MGKPQGPTRREMLLAATASLAAGAMTTHSAEPAAKEGAAMKLEQASRFAQLALKGIQKEYPNKPGDVLNSERDVKAPRVVHPAFYGSFDWHSAVHGHWMPVRLLRLFPDLPDKKTICDVLAEHLTAKNLQAEADYFDRPNTQSFERPYGWAWLLKLAEELHTWDAADAKEWAKNLKPLTDKITARYLAYFPKQTYPIRSGVHPNTAFGLAFARDYARAVGHKKLRELLEKRSHDYYAGDVDAPAKWEPDGTDFFPPSLMEADLMRRLLRPRDFVANRLRRLNLAPEVRAAVEGLFVGDGEPEPEFIGQLIQGEMAQLLASTVAKGEPLSEGIAAQLPPARVHQVENAVKEPRGESATPTDRTVKAQADSWLAGGETKVAAGQLTAARVNNVRMALAHFTRWLGETADVTGIDAAKLQGFYQFCLTQVAARQKDKKAGWSLPFAKETFAIAKAFIRWLIEQGTISPPTNIAARFRFGSTTKKIPTWKIPEVQHVIGEAPGKLKLALLLMVNCGMTQVDVSDLADDEVDWTHGTITRRRSKTKNNENVPVVTYRLWPLTWQQLQQYRSGAEQHVLLTDSGLPYVRSELLNGKLVKADGFTSNYAHLKRRLKFGKSMKLLRKTAATMLESHPVYGRLVPHFLGHSPRGVAAKHYAAPPQKLFDEAVRWLGEQLGFVDASRPTSKKRGATR